MYFKYILHLFSTKLVSCILLLCFIPAQKRQVTHFGVLVDQLWITWLDIRLITVWDIPSATPVHAFTCIIIKP